MKINPETYDITFIGHVCYDEIEPFEGQKTISAGSAVLQGAVTASCCGLKICVITRQEETNSDITNLLKENKVSVYSLPAKQTSRMLVIHPSPDMDVREMTLKKMPVFLLYPIFRK